MFAQSRMPPPPYGDYQQPVQSIEQKWAEIQRDLRRDQYSAPTEPRVVKKGLLAPSVSDRTNFAAFLRTANAGLVRLLPEGTFDDKVYETHKELHIPGGGAFYSFANHTHAGGYTSDIKLKDDKLITGLGGTQYGAFRSLGDVPLESITLSDSRLEFLSAYQAPRSLEESRSEAARFLQGVGLGGVLYRSEVQVQVNATYLLRSIAYRYVDGSDALFAFRVVRKDSDGGVIIAWKPLKKYRTPSLPRPSRFPSRLPSRQPGLNRWPTR